jgi:hypothetical protein
MGGACVSVGLARVKESVTGDVCGWAGCVSVSGHGYGEMGFETGFFDGVEEDLVSGRVFAARFQTLVCPGMGCGMCLSLLDTSLQAILIRI